MRSIPEQRIAEFQEQDYQLYFGISKLEFDRMLKALHEAYRQEHKRKTRFTKISMMDKLILTLIYRYEYRTMESIAKEYEVSLDTIADNIHWVERTLLNADILQTSVTFYKGKTSGKAVTAAAMLFWLRSSKNENCVFCTDAVCTLNFSEKNSKMMLYVS